MRDLIEQIGLQPEHFDTLIIIVIIVGSIWAILRIYRDLTSPPREDTAEFYDYQNQKNEGTK